MGIAAHQNADLGPVTADASDHVLEDGPHFPACGRLAFPQDHRHRLAAGSFVDVDRQEAAFVVVRVEQRQLLMTVHGIEGVVDIERDRGRRAAVTRAELVNHGRHRPRDLDLRGGILQPRHRRLRAQRLARSRQPAHRHLEDRIVSQRIAIVGVLVARGDREHPKPEHFFNRMQNQVRIALVSQARCQTRHNSQPLLDPPQQKHARVR